MPETYDFFISYNKTDRRWAEWIAWQLEAKGYTTVIQAWDFLPGGNFVLQMQEAATKAERTIAVLSPDYLTSRFTQPEWAAAFAQDPTGEKGLLVPVRVRVCEMEGLLPQIVYIDLVGLGETVAKEALLSGVEQRRAKPSEAPGFPGEGERKQQVPAFPGALPPIWNVPHNRNLSFTGRETLLEALHDALHSGQPAALTQAISGLGGVGKTQLAVEYSYRYHADYDWVWWLRSEEPTTLAGDYAALAQERGLPEKDATEQEVIIEAVKRHLSRTRGWLLIFDNAEAKDAVYPYLPQGAGGHVIITSRNKHWTGVASPLTVPIWEREESIRFLLDRTGRDDAAGAAQMADVLGDLPLALEQAAAYVEESSLSFSKYVVLFNERRAELWDDEEHPLAYPETVATTWSLSMERVEEETEIGRDILAFCAFVAPDDIPRLFLAALAKHLPENRAAPFTNDLARNRGIKALSRHSLIEASPDTLSVHRLVQAVVRDRLSNDEAAMWTAAAVAVIKQAWPPRIDVYTWSDCEQLMPHSSACMQQAAALDLVLEEVAGLAYNMGFYLDDRAAYEEAELYSRRALEGYEQVLGPNHPDTLGSVNNLAGLLQAKGDLDAAEPLFRRALEGYEQVLGPNHPDTLGSVNNLAGLLYAKGELDAAEPFLRRAFRGLEKLLGPAHPTTQIVRGNLNFLLQQLGKPEE